jgi:hypothetical protein
MARSSTWVRGGIFACLLAQLGAAQPRDAQALDARGARSDEGEGTAAPGATAEAAANASPAWTLGHLEATECLGLLEIEQVPHERLERLRAVDAPVLLTAPLGGVAFTSALRRGAGAFAPEPLDCRLALALDALAPLLLAHGVVRVVHYGIYRGDVPWPRRGAPMHHAAGLAIDVAAFIKADGSRLDVRNDWIRGPSSGTCRGDALPDTASPRAIELHAILCEIVERRLFQEVLTPNHDAKHRDHFHLEVVRHAEWVLVR